MEEKTSKLGVYKVAQIKRMALGMRPIMRKVETLNSKINKLAEEKESLILQCREIENCIKAYVGDEDQMKEAQAVMDEVLGVSQESPVETTTAPELGELGIPEEEFNEGNTGVSFDRI